MHVRSTWYGWAGGPATALPRAIFLVLSVGPAAFLAVLWLQRAAAEGWQPLAWALPPARSLQLLGNSLAMAMTVAVAAALLGTGLAAWIWQGGRWQRRLRSLYLLPLLVPPYIHALSWLALAGRRQPVDRAISWLLGSGYEGYSAYGFLPATAVLVFCTFPIVTLLVLEALDSIDPAYIETALLAAPLSQTVWRVLLPLALPSILGGAGIVLVLAFLEYGVPSILQYNVYVMDVYASFSQYNDPGRAFAASLALMIPAAAVVAFSQRPLRSSALRGQGALPCSLAGERWPAAAGVPMMAGVVAWAVAMGVLGIVLLSRGGAPAVLASALAPAGREMLLTFLVAALSAVLAMAVAVPVAAGLVGRRRGGMLAWLVCALPLAVPPPVVGIGLVQLWNRPGLGVVLDSPLMLVLAHAARFLPFAVFAAAVQWRHVDPLLLEAAQLHPVGAGRRLLSVFGPLAAPAMSAAWLAAFVFSLGELGTSLLVAPPGEATVPLRAYNLLHYGATDTVAALSLAVLAGGAAVAAMVLSARQRLWGRIG